ncbi:MAG: C_GCAxxG_C_C family protein [Deltaproteobacteria bacterium]|nr:C_GCAxxG_C_C family protein [Deltaproteobacteria bacterium]
MAVGAVHGRTTLPEGEGKEAIKKAVDQLYGRQGLYRLFNQIPNKFKDRYGNTLCRDLTSLWHDDWLCREHAVYCHDIITDAAEFAANLIMTNCEEASSKPFGKNVENLQDE